MINPIVAADMKRVACLLASLCLIAASPTKAEQKAMSIPQNLQAVSPALDKYAKGPMTELWSRSQLGARDRSIVTVSAMIARNQTATLSEQIALALDNGVKPRELSEIIAHLAFYSGWGNAIAAVAAAAPVFEERHIGADQLPPASPSPLPLDEEAEKQRAQRVGEQFEAVAPGVTKYTTEVLFRDLWLRPDLAPRDRSLVTVSALVASGQVVQIPFHLSRAMNNGLTQEEASEVMTQLAFYAGWPSVMSALPVVKDVFQKRLE